MNLLSNKLQGRDTISLVSLFGTDGIRGTVGKDLSVNLVYQIGFCAGQILQLNSLKSGPIIVGQDSRNSSEMLTKALTLGLSNAGLEVWNLGLCPSATVSFLTQNTAAIGGVMISASHNPPEDNGIKFFDQDGCKLSEAVQAAIATAIYQAPLPGQICDRKLGKRYDRSELIADYHTLLCQFICSETSSEKPLQGLRVVLDLAWGAAVDLAPQVFHQLGAEVFSLHALADGDRINVNCGSTHLVPLQTAVQEIGADLGFAFDGDADRVLAVDAQGQTVDGDHILYLWGHQLQQQQRLPQNLLVATVMSNLAFEQAWQQQGGKLIRTAVGDHNVCKGLRESGGVLGGEQSGHILCRHYGNTGDGIATALHLAKLVQQTGRSLATLLEDSFQAYPQILCNVRVVDRDRRIHWKNCEELQKVILRAETALGTCGRILVRSSGTEPVLRIMVEAATASLASFWSQEITIAAEHYLAA